MKKYPVLLLCFLFFISSCEKKNIQESLCETIECFNTDVEINGNIYPFNQTIFSFGTLIPDQTSILIINEFSLFGEDAIEAFNLNGVPFKVGVYSLGNIMGEMPSVRYIISSKTQGQFEEAYLIEGYDNWIEITDICDSAMKGTAHFQLLEAGGNHSIIYNHADTLTVHFDFSMCP